jgi:NADH:ubiquinone oxidoreductase subunit 5 (subunit L)/multisubunit Na+/H+ antiporter MnhA subunit
MSLQIIEGLPRLIPVCAAVLSLGLPTNYGKVLALYIGQLTACAFAFIGVYLFLKQYDPASPVALHGLMRIDAWSVFMAAFVALVGSVVVIFAERNLVTKPTRVPFIRNVVLLAAVPSWLVASNNLVIVLPCLVTISTLLPKIVGLEPRAAASAKLIRRYHLAADLCFALAFVLITVTYGSADLGYLSSHHSDSVQASHFLNDLIALLLTFGIFIKSSVFPFNRWLVATIDGPTPLSPVLHAGIVNIGVVINVRLITMFTESPHVQIFLVVWAVLAAFIGMIEASVTPGVKRQICKSTGAQVAFMVAESGVGAVAAAFFHLVAHGWYKVSLFLGAHNSIWERKVKIDHAYYDGGLPKSQAIAQVAFLAAITVPAGYFIIQQDHYSANSTASVFVLLMCLILMPSVPVLRRVPRKYLAVAWISFLVLVLATGRLGQILSYYMPPLLVHADLYLLLIVLALAVLRVSHELVRDTALGMVIYVAAVHEFYLDEPAARVGSFFAKQKNLARTLFARLSTAKR